MFNSKTKINFTNLQQVKNDIYNSLKGFKEDKNLITQKNFFHTSTVKLQVKTAEINVTFSKSFYIFYVISGIITAILPFENALIGSSAFAVFIIFSTVMYFSLDYKLKTILDGFN